MSWTDALTFHHDLPFTSSPQFTPRHLSSPHLAWLSLPFTSLHFFYGFPHTFTSKQSLFNFKDYDSLPEKNHWNLIQNSRCPGRYSNRLPPAYRSESLPAEPDCSVNPMLICRSPPLDINWHTFHSLGGAGSSWETDSLSAGQEIPQLLRNAEVHCCVQRSYHCVLFWTKWIHLKNS